MPSPRVLAITGSLLLALSLVPTLLAHAVIVAWAVAVLALLSLVVIVHEVGHALAARAVGIEVSCIRIGIGPQLIGLRLGGVAVNVHAIPLAGQAIITGMTPESAAGHDPTITYAHASLRARTAVALGGVGANIISAWAVLSLWGLTQGAGWAAPLRAIQALVFLGQIIAVSVGALLSEGVGGLARVDSMITMPGVLEQASALASPAQVLLISFVLISVLAAAGNLVPLAPLDGFLLAIIAADALRRVFQPQAAPIPAASYRAIALASALPLIALALLAYSQDIYELLIS